MSFLHSHSCECIKSELDLFALPSTQTSIESGMWVQYKPISSLADDGPIEFQVPGTGDDYIDLSHTLIQLKAKILNEDSSKLAASTVVAPVNNWLHSVFTQLDVYLNQKLVSPPNNTYAYRAYIETLLNYSSEAKQSHLTCSLWYEDTAGKMDSTEEKNSGFTKRQQLVSESKEVEMIGHLHGDIFNQEKFLINGVEMSIKLVRSRETFNLMAPTDDVKYKINITDATLLVRRTKINPSVLLAHQKVLATTTAKYPITRAEVKVLTIPSGVQGQPQRNTKHDEVHEVSLGVVFEQHSEEIQEAFKFAMVQYSNNMNKTRLDFQLFVDVINTADAFKLSRLICNQFSRGVISMLGAVTPDSFDTLHSYTNTFQVPFVTPWFPEKVIPPSGLIDYAISLRPEYHKAVIDTVTYYGWKSIIYVYDSYDGLLRLQQLYQSLQPGKASFRITNVKRVANATEVVEFLGSLEMLDRWSNKYVVLDSSTKLAKDALILHVRDVRLGRRNYHYLLSGLVMDDHWEKDVSEFGAINITGFRVLDLSRKIVQNFIELWRRDSISAQAALMYDAVQILIDSILRMLRKKPDFLRGTMRRNANTTNSKIIDCNPNNKISPYEYGERISRMIKRTEMEGLTGLIRFNEAGHRRNFTLQVMEMTVDVNMVKVGTWYDNKGLVPISPKLPGLTEVGHYDRNKTYIVATIIEEPYVSRNTDHDNPNSKLRGFCVDLTYLVLEKLEINFEMRLVKDGNYGNENPKMIGGWDGLVGELVRKEVDLVIAPLTVNLEREQVIDFSKPFLSFDVQSEKNSSSNIATIFSFLSPLSMEIWLCIPGSIVGVSFCMFLVSRISPNEWRITSLIASRTTENNEIATTQTVIVNDFSFWNALWFSLSSFMQQGSDITPRSLSGRIVSVVWCFFALIFVSTYTANMASYLTIHRISEPLLTYTRVTTCPVDYVKRPSKSTQDDLWMGFISPDSFLSSSEVQKPCEMLVSVTHSGVKDFAIAFPKGSKLRDGVNLALQSLKNNGELQQLVRTWFIDAKCSLEGEIHGKELTLNQLAGLFYILVGGMGLALGVALFELIRHGKAEAVRANVSLRKALRSKATGSSGVNTPETEPPEEHLEQEHLEWNGAAYTGYFSTSSQAQAAVQEETSLHASFTPV